MALFVVCGAAAAVQWCQTSLRSDSNGGTVRCDCPIVLLRAETLVAVVFERIEFVDCVSVIRDALPDPDLAHGLHRVLHAKTLDKKLRGMSEEAARVLNMVYAPAAATNPASPGAAVLVALVVAAIN